MSIDVGPIGSPDFPPASAGASRRAPRAEAAATSVDAVGAVPDSPPPEVLEAVDAASRCYRELHAQGRELRFDVDDVAGGRVRVAVCDLDGNVLREIPPSEALDVATGAALE